MQQQIENKVKTTTKKLSKELEENSGIKASLEMKDIEEYIKLVMKEKQKMSEEKK